MDLPVETYHQHFWRNESHKGALHAVVADIIKCLSCHLLRLLCSIKEHLVTISDMPGTRAIMALSKKKKKSVYYGSLRLEIEIFRQRLEAVSHTDFLKMNHFDRVRSDNISQTH
jgi:hypothetical protein